MADQFTAIIPAGGRFFWDEDSLEPIKALVQVNGQTLLEILLKSISQVSQIGCSIVVGPYDLEAVAKQYKAAWVDDTGSLLGNVQAGLKWDPTESNSRIVVIAADMVNPMPDSISTFLKQSSGDAQLTIPLISKSEFFDAYPGSPSTFVKLREGEFTVGSLLTAPAGLIKNPPAAVGALLGNRKSQFAMAKGLGFSVIWQFLTGALSIASLEKRISELTGVESKAIRDCSPDLALDIDDARDLDYARSIMETQTEKT